MQLTGGIICKYHITSHDADLENRKERNKNCPSANKAAITLQYVTRAATDGISLDRY